MAGINQAIERRDWEVVALYLVLGVARTARRLPRGTVADLLELLSPAATDGGTCQ